jgi:hypothetical protein
MLNECSRLHKPSTKLSFCLEDCAPPLDSFTSRIHRGKISSQLVFFLICMSSFWLDSEKEALLHKQAVKTRTLKDIIFRREHRSLFQSFCLDTWQWSVGASRMECLWNTTSAALGTSLGMFLATIVSRGTNLRRAPASWIECWSWRA